MAFGAVAGTVDQIGAALPRRRLRWIGTDLLSGKKQELPAAHEPANVEWKRHRLLARLSADRRQGLEVGEQVAHVGERHVLIGAIRKDGIVMLARWRSAFGERGDEIGLAPAADAVV